MTDPRVDEDPELDEFLPDLVRQNAWRARAATRRVLREWWRWIALCLVAGIGLVVATNFQLGIDWGRTVSIIGLVMDVLGVFILARGVLMTSREIERTALFTGVDRRDEYYRNRAEGWIGVLIMGLGFVFQLTGSIL